jgi:hypothetical protein
MLQDKQDSAVSEFNARRVPRRHDHFAALLCDNPCHLGPVWLSQHLSACDCPEKEVPDLPAFYRGTAGGLTPSLYQEFKTLALSHKSRQAWGPASSVLADKILDGIFKFS